MKCNQDCNQGRMCHCNLDEQPTIFETIIDFAVAGILALGAVTAVATGTWLAWRFLT